MIKRKFGKYTVTLNKDSIKITDDWLTNLGVVYDHVKPGERDIYGVQKLPFAMDFEIGRKDIKEWLTKRIFKQRAKAQEDIFIQQWAESVEVAIRRLAATKRSLEFHRKQALNKIPIFIQAETLEEHEQRFRKEKQETKNIITQFKKALVNRGSKIKWVTHCNETIRRIAKIL